ncbi:MAG: 16S rRNA (cytosine(967)-C(5))-methyltransferase RsmB [Clostridia bacterium]|nr:16S rRNA (cytosine(967)-C(5))-methyltransferase RsmB [Clostridia bacterium]
MVNARKTAVGILINVLNDGAYSNIAIKNELDGSRLEREDKALATALVYGVLDRKITIDYVISKYVRKSVERIAPVTLNALRIALYQIMFMDKIPQSAAVNESVNLVKGSKERYNASFVNGVLRSFLREPAKMPAGDDAYSISVRYSCPEWIVSGFISDYGIATAIKLLEESLKKPPVCLRVNTLKTDPEKLIDVLKKEGIKAEKSPIEGALTVNSTMDIANSEAFNDGLFHVEDPASQKMLSKVGFRENMRVLDLCSAPGGKAFTVAEYLENNGEIVACDMYEHRVELIKKGASRLGISIIKPFVNDATGINKDLGLFDVVLCDVPCSGLGVIRRKPEIKYKKINENDYDLLLRTQQKIVENADRYLKPGGTLVYSTCTLKRAENEDQITSFLDKHGDYDVKYNVNYMPHIDGTDGFFTAILCKKR